MILDLMAGVAEVNLTSVALASALAIHRLSDSVAMILAVPIPVEDPVVSLSGMTQVLSLAVTGFQTLILTQVVMTVVVVLGAVLRIEDLGGTC
jgi:hypothetical protein